MKKQIHVTPNGEKWNVASSNSKKAFRTVPTQKQAIEIGRKVAINQSTELVIRGKNGQIREKNSYGKDNFPPKG